MPLPSLKRWRNWVPHLPHGGSRLGELTVAGAIYHSRGVPRHRPRILGQWALVYLVGGGGIYRDERGIPKPVDAGDCILVVPEVAHAYGPGPGMFWDELYVCFQGPVFDAWREAGPFDIREPVKPWLPPAEAHARFAAFFERVEKRGCTSLEAVCHWQVLLAEIFRPPTGVDTNRPAWLANALDLLEEPSSELKLVEVARTCGMGYESFRKKFEAAMGQPPAHYALGRRVERARRLIAAQGLTNKELAVLLGFYDEFHFSRTFTRFTGVTPSAFRRDARRG